MMPDSPSTQPESKTGPNIDIEATRRNIYRLFEDIPAEGITSDNTSGKITTSLTAEERPADPTFDADGNFSRIHELKESGVFVGPLVLAQHAVRQFTLAA